MMNKYKLIIFLFMIFLGTRNVIGQEIQTYKIHDNNMEKALFYEYEKEILYDNMLMPSASPTGYEENYSYNVFRFLLSSSVANIKSFDLKFSILDLPDSTDVYIMSNDTGAVGYKPLVLSNINTDTISFYNFPGTEFVLIVLGKSVSYSNININLASVTIRDTYKPDEFNFKTGFNSPNNGCTQNINCDPDIRSTWSNQARSTFRYWFKGGGYCTGTLINQDVDDNNLKQYFLTARHCLYDNILNELSHDSASFSFNYQSPDCNTLSVPLNAQDGGRYFFTSNVNILERNFQHDMILVEIVDPIPAHFNVYYAGWDARAWGMLPKFGGINISHPQGDIKKYATPKNMYVTGSTVFCPIVVNVGTVISNIPLIGWVVRPLQETIQVACGTIQNPFIVVDKYNSGGTNNGSSGSALFNNGQRIVGALSWAPVREDVCNSGAGLRQDNYGRFDGFFNQSLLQHKLLPNSQTRYYLDGRDRHCVSDLNLSGNYYPAKDYQPENQVVLRASNTVATNSSLVVYNGADFVFTAGSQINLKPGFIVQAGGTFKATISSCIPRSGRLAFNEGFDEEEKDRFSEENQSQETEQYDLDLYPNPNNGEKLIVKSNNFGKKIQYFVYDLKGFMLQSEKLNILNDTMEFELNKPAGVYIVRFINENGQQIYKKLVIE